MESQKENIITYETIFDILRKERSSEALQRLDDRFYSDIVSYIRGKQDSDDKELLLNVKKMLKDIYERREKKIVGLAIDRVKLGMEGLNTANLLKEERGLFESLVAELIKSRKTILDTVLSLKVPQFEQSLSINEPLLNVNEQQEIPMNNNSKTIESKKATMVRFLHAVPRFVGKELEEYGPFSAEEIANLPTEISNLLIAKGRAEEIKDR